MEDIFHRSRLLLGNSNFAKLSKVKIIIFGIGGVGSWCAESLIRSGVQNITIVDSDHVSVSNINRQAMANVNTVGQEKTEALKNLLLQINPEANIITKQLVYSAENSSEFHLDDYDYIVDAIDSIKNKVHLIQTATKTNAVLFSAMGAALKISPEKIKVAEFWKISGCPLAASLRKRFKQFGMPSKKFLCVYSDEYMDVKDHAQTDTCDKCQDEKEVSESFFPDDIAHTKTVINGSIVHITGIFGFTLAGLLIEDICRN